MSDDLDLAKFISEVTGDELLKIEENFGSGFVRLRVAEAERRQAAHDIRSSEDIIIELLRNSRDAQARNIFVASAKAQHERLFVIIDDGLGIPEDMQAKVFEPRVTSKLTSIHEDKWGIHGRGMALFSIASNTLEHRVLRSKEKLGTSIRVLSNTLEVSEKTDQSSWPQLTKNEEGIEEFTGPKNIIRSICEFAHDSKGALKVYLGSPTEIAATLYAHAKSRLSAQDLLFIDSADSLKLIDRLAFSSDAEDFTKIANELGLEISERSAFRILSGQISPNKHVLEVLNKRKTPKPTSLIHKDLRGLKIAPDDMKTFERDLKRSFRKLSEGYFLEDCKTPKVRITKDKIVVTFDLSKDDSI
ncbi:MAG: ATP-binding protein [Coriobacteriia bacterium]|nr:ATP-binding protein [Coriobacteriia bacterium]